MIEISLEQAQRFILEKQGLLTSKPSQTTLDVAKRIHNIQVDTISVVARSHNLTVFHRFPQYQVGNIWKLLEQKKVFECYSHALCLMSIEEYPFYKWRMANYRVGEKSSYWKTWITENKTVIDYVYDYIKKNGAVCSADFKVPEERKSGGWWNWKKEKRALEHLFLIGKLMIAYRKGFQKYYDLTERVLPDDINHEPMSLNSLPHYLFHTIFSAIGLGNFEEMRHYIESQATKILWNNDQKKITAFLEQQVKVGELEQVKIAGIKHKHYVLTSEYNTLTRNDTIESSYMKFINPFDNIARERKFLNKFWNFNYTLEAYVPGPKRKYGYYLMPILDGHQLIGRLEPKVYRKDKILEIKSIFFEDWYNPDNQSLDKLVLGIHRFASFHNCEKIKIGNTFPSKYKLKIEKQL